MITDFLINMRRNRFDPEYLPGFESKLFFEGERKNKQVVNFIVMLALATVIATYGVVTDSTASVIGAMIIAPLMTPIMASAAAVILGQLSASRRHSGWYYLVYWGLSHSQYCSPFLSRTR